MNGIDPYTVVTQLGFLSGALALCIALYLQVITRKQVELRYVAMFYTLGCAVIMLHSSLLFRSPLDALLARLFGVVLISVVELIGGYWVYKNTDVENPVSVVERLFRAGADTVGGDQS